MNTVIYPGSFNPITNGHTDLVKRALSLFDHVIVAIGTSAQKDPAVDLKDRIELCEEVLAEFGGKGFGQFKPALAELAVNVLSPITGEMNRMLADPAYVDGILHKGYERANAIAAPHLAEVKEIVGFLKP